MFSEQRISQLVKHKQTRRFSATSVLTYFKNFWVKTFSFQSLKIINLWNINIWLLLFLCIVIVRCPISLTCLFEVICWLMLKVLASMYMHFFLSGSAGMTSPLSPQPPPPGPLGGYWDICKPERWCNGSSVSWVCPIVSYWLCMPKTCPRQIFRKHVNSMCEHPQLAPLSALPDIVRIRT